MIDGRYDVIGPMIPLDISVMVVTVSRNTAGQTPPERVGPEETKIYIFALRETWDVSQGKIHHESLLTMSAHVSFDLVDLTPYNVGSLQ